MFKIHTLDGQTTKVNLSDEKQAIEWMKKLKTSEFQQIITGITVLQECGGKFRCPYCNKANNLVCHSCGTISKNIKCHTGIQYSLSKPNAFSKIFYHIEKIEPVGKIKGGEKIICFVDDVKLTLMTHNSQPSARISLLKTGKQRYNPYIDDIRC